ncbi:solute carrier family 25 member 39 [Caerostris extrusa]|uniref:Solute carrier family 25 member 39 n=1 Tax=Caerostris extrusa TaxID=172846 RepID=A0AAV4NFN6_CAEEX|nr:solute carrier family 25 member 39 [Caerostris extrusa]
MSLKENISSNYHAGKFHSTISDQLLSSCVGSIFTSVFVTPFDVVKTRLQVQVKPQSDPKACSIYELCIQENQKLIKGGIQCCKVRKIPYKGTVASESNLYSWIDILLITKICRTIILPKNPIEMYRLLGNLGSKLALLSTLHEEESMLINLMIKTILYLPKLLSRQ